MTQSISKSTLKSGKGADISRSHKLGGSVHKKGGAPMILEEDIASEKDSEG